MMNLRTLQVQSVIFHDVPKHFVKTGGEQIRYSQAPILLDSQLRGYLQQRIVGSLETAGYRVEPDPETKSLVPDLILNRLTDNTTDFVTMSRTMAEYLQQSQTGANPGGLLCLAEVILDTGPGLAILKLAREEAVRIEPQTDIQGRFIFDLEHVRDIIFSNRTRVFKAGLFVLQDETAGLVGGLVSDNQRSYTSQIEVAEFFLKSFLGCKLTDSPEIITKTVLSTTEEFISTKVGNSENRARYTTALYAEFGNEKNTFSPLAFAETNFRPEDRRPYREWLAQHGVEPRQFVKNTDLIDERLKKVTMAFARNIVVTYLPNALVVSQP